MSFAFSVIDIDSTVAVDKSTKHRDLSSTHMESVNLVNDQNWASDLPPQLSAFPMR